jgi:formate dehydrogenase major subunit
MIRIRSKAEARRGGAGQAVNQTAACELLLQPRFRMAASVSLSSTAVATLGCSQDPISRGTLCPKGAALLDFVKAPARLFIPNIGRPAGRKLAIQIWSISTEPV